VVVTPADIAAAAAGAVAALTASGGAVA